jgi:hypothetical protein
LPAGVGGLPLGGLPLGGLPLGGLPLGLGGEPVGLFFAPIADCNGNFLPHLLHFTFRFFLIASSVVFPDAPQYGQLTSTTLDGTGEGFGAVGDGAGAGAAAASVTQFKKVFILYLLNNVKNY